MRDDLIQGITFSRSEMIDLRRLSRRERMMFKMLATKKSLQQLTASPLQKQSTTTVKRRDFVVIRAGAERQQDLKQLRDRLKQV